MHQMIEKSSVKVLINTDPDSTKTSSTIGKGQQRSASSELYYNLITLLPCCIEFEFDNLSGGYRHWSRDPERSAEVENLPPWQAYSHTQSLDIEMTAYALLAYSAFDMMVEALPVVKWLTSKQSGSGGFRSTQVLHYSKNPYSAAARAAETTWPVASWLLGHDSCLGKYAISQWVRIIAFIP